jgi:ABC-type dipeptide/oligopeptide/nickel transport system ATPase component
MAVISINGLSGSGKTLQATAIAIKHFEKENNIIKRLVRRIKKEDIYINNVYSNYPILLKKKPLIYSKKLSTFQLDNSYRFLPNSLLINDEVQICYDSDEFKAFPKLIANFNQAQRHFYIKDIIYISQHPSRIIKKLRNVISEFRKIRRTFILPFLKIGFIYYTIYYELRLLVNGINLIKWLKLMM